MCFLTRKPSSSAQWHHRFWLIEQELTQQPRPSSNSLLEREHTVVALAATRKPRNYYAWTYRVKLRQLVRIVLGCRQDVWDDARMKADCPHYLRMIGTTEAVASRVEMASQLSDGKEWNVIPINVDTRPSCPIRVGRERQI
ncbi:hypothetical protein BCR44DRAFT_1423133 [Catenaria anguillulae PL171]|uniref:Uncharacterized protein n=1 Tax=Catenaria anguillulae PL171 TaxID=765915 RepID=A0A1Y2I420_9FUNG|nr:hypothetical protein BCR44DRAFT_1423133 [Catenaria anguillulae PL171]